MRRIALATLPLVLLGVLLGGCDTVVLSPSGYVAAQQRDLLIGATLLMLLIIIPVMGLTVFFAWRYSAKRSAVYDPNWSHSANLELIIWTAPLLIIICLSAMTWVGTHLLDPFRPLEKIGERRPVAANVEPLEIEVVALDWKWLFVYPQYGIATINQAAAPVDRPIRFHITAQSVMNAFYVPALAGMIYAMPGMESQLNAVMNLPGSYDGFSTNYSGAGFSGMRFDFEALDQAGFDVWVGKARVEGQPMLGRAEYLALAEPSENVPKASFSDVDPDLFRRIVNRCVEEGRLCIDQMAALDARGGTGLAGTLGTMPAAGRVASAFGALPFYAADICTAAEAAAYYGKGGVALLDPPVPDAAAGAGATEKTF